MPAAKTKESSTRARTKRQPISAKRVPATKTATNTMNFRVDAATRSTIEQAAEASGKSLTEFVLEAARAQAEEVLLNRSFFSLEDKAWNALTVDLDAPPSPNAALASLLKSKEPWD